MLWIELSPHQNSHIEALTSNVTILGDRASKEVRSQGDLIDWCPFRKRKKPQNSLTGTDSVCRFHREKAMWQHSEKVTTCQARREVSAETNAAGTWSWASNLQNGEKISCFCCLSDPVCGMLLWYGNPSWLVQSRSISKLTMACHQVQWCICLKCQQNQTHLMFVSYQCPSHSPWLLKNLSVVPFCFYAWSSVAFL